MKDCTDQHPLVILGATGQLGSDLVRVAGKRDVPFVGLGHEDIEITEPDTVESVFHEIEPSVVLNCAAFHDVDGCETNPEKAFRVNAVGALHVARTAPEVGGRTIYISTDYVFGGEKPPPEDGQTTPDHAYSTTDQPDPMNVYGTSKHAGEQLTHQADSNSLVARVSSLFGIEGARGKGGGNFIDMMLNLAEEHDQLQGVDNQWMTPTYCRHAADALLDLATNPDATGTVHVTAPNACTWYDLAQTALRAAGKETTIERVDQEAFSSKADKPTNSALNTDQLEQYIGRRLPAWEEGVNAYLEERQQTVDSS